MQPKGLSPQNIPAKAGYSCVKANVNEALAFDLVLSLRIYVLQHIYSVGKTFTVLAVSENGDAKNWYVALNVCF